AGEPLRCRSGTATGILRPPIGVKPAGGSGFFYDQRCDDSSLLTVLIVVHLEDCPLGAAGERYRIALADVVAVERGDPDYAPGGVDQAILEVRHELDQASWVRSAMLPSSRFKNDLAREP